MPTLRLRDAGTGEGHGGEMFGCVYTPDGAFVLSAGWDGCLRLWQASSGESITSLRVAVKPLSCCAIAPDGKTWLSASMEGVLSWSDALTHQSKLSFLAHIRPISSIQYAPDGRSLATASWDRKLVVRKVGKEREGVALTGHSDIVAGCRWSSDGKQLLSWSHDGTLRLWDTDAGRELAQFAAHQDRVTAGCLSLDGCWAVSGDCDGTVKVWDLRRRAEAFSVHLKAEVRGCWCLLDNESFLTVNADGQVVLWSRELEVLAEIACGIKVVCGDLSPFGNEVALGSEDGKIHYIAIDGYEDSPILVTPTQSLKRKPSMVGRILGKEKVERVYEYICPICRHSAEVAQLPSQSITCGACKRLLRLNQVVRELQPR